MMLNDIIKCRFESKIRGPDSPYVFICNDEINKDKLEEMRHYSKTQLNDQWRWVIDPEVEREMEYMDMFFSL